ncbi:flippase [Listeria aquatica]|uniref:Flippase n=2 Tax=Listeria aquatica TaxID=1494960 RepID=A0A841ZQS7_9LIST|nr:flippase [Listeria aquatica]MBC1521704.1 flippase [Listeria aquatica]
MKILKNYAYNMTYQILLMLIPLVTVPYISRTLGAEGIGVYAYTYSVVQYFILIGNLGISIYGARSIAQVRESDQDRSRVFFELMIIKLVMFFISALLYGLFIYVYGEYTFIFILQGIFILAAAVDISWFFIGLEDFKKTISRNIVVKLVALVSVFIFIRTPNDIALYVAINAISTFLGNLTLWTYLRKRIHKVAVKNLDLKPHVRPVFFLFLPQLLTQIFVNMNKLFLGNFSTLTQTGYFENSDKVVRMLSACVTAIGNVIFPRIANEFHKGEAKTANNYTLLSFQIVNMISIPLLFGMILISKNFSLLFFGENFDGIEYVLAILSVGLLFMGWGSIIGQQYMVAANQVAKSIVSLIVGILVSIALSFLLIPSYGALGAAISSVAGEAVIAIAQIIMIRKSLQIHLFKETAGYVIAALVMVVAGFGMGMLIKGTFYSMCVQIATAVVVYAIFMILIKPAPVRVLMDKFKNRN